MLNLTKSYLDLFREWEAVLRVAGVRDGILLNGSSNSNTYKCGNRLLKIEKKNHQTDITQTLAHQHAILMK